MVGLFYRYIKMEANVKYMKFYKMYGLIIKSEFEIPEAYEITEQKQWDVFVEMGQPSMEILKQAKEGKVCQLEKGKMWFYLENMGLFYTENGNYIRIYRETERLTDLARNSYLTGTVMGLILFQRGIIPIHSGAVAKNGKVVCIVGYSGAGKSTTSVMLREKGCEFVSDDVSAITIEDKKVMVSLAFPQQKLCKDAALRQGYHLEDLIYIDEFRDKYAIRLQDGFIKEALPLGAIVELEVAAGESVEVREIVGIEKMELLFRNIYRGLALNEIGMSGEMRRNILKIAEKVPMYQIKRPIEGYHTEEITEKILKLLWDAG